jgi:hypothetical protein
VLSLFLEKSTLSRYFGKVRNSPFETAKNRGGGSVLAKIVKGSWLEFPAKFAMMTESEI